MTTTSGLIKEFNIPAKHRKRTTLAKSRYYDKIELYKNRVVGYLDGAELITWYFKDYKGIDFVKANMNSQFAQIVFLTGLNSKNRAIGIDLFATQNLTAAQDTNRILFCSGMFSFKQTNTFADSIVSEIRPIFTEYKNNDESKTVTSEISVADELKKFKDLLDSDIITEEEFNAKKKQLLNL